MRTFAKKQLPIWGVAIMLQAWLMPVDAAEHIVEIVNFRFSPADLTIKPGDTVTWVNRDVVPHNVSAGSENNWSSPNLLKGEKFSIVLKDDISYTCSLHEAVMQGLILVSED